MTNKPSSKGSNPLRLRLLGQAAVKAGTENDEPRMKAAGERALDLAAEAERAEAAERAQRSAEAVEKAIRKGKSGFVIENGMHMIIEK